jgi:hypothetical protein
MIWFIGIAPEIGNDLNQDTGKKPRPYELFYRTTFAPPLRYLCTTNYNGWCILERNKTYPLIFLVYTRLGEVVHERGV